MAYYLIITSIFFTLIDYKYIYKFIDSRFLYLTPGSKLKKEINHNIGKMKSMNSRDWIIILCVFIAIFLFSFSISTIIFNSKPILLRLFSKTLNLTEIFSGYEMTVIMLYHGLAAICIISLTYDNLDKIKKIIFVYFNKVIKKENIKKDEVKTQYVIAKDESDEVVTVNEEDLYQNVLITGSIGSGKTSGAIARITYPIIKSGKGGVVLDAKGNFVDTVSNMCKMCGRENDLVIISNNSNNYFELLSQDESPLELANKLKQIIMLLSPTNNSDTYWLDKVENVLMNLIIILKFKNMLDFLEIHKMITDDGYLKNIIYSIKEDLKKDLPDDKTAFELSNAISFLQNEFFKLDIRVNSIIKSEITRLTIPLITDYNIYSQFCKKGNKTQVTFSNNKIIVLSLNIGENKALSKIISTFLKISYERYILSNISKQIPSFFIADEFQEFCNTEDAHFFSLSREAKCINIISTQSYSSLKNSLKDTNATNVIIQNLVNKIWFRNDDNYTISEIIKQLGKVNVIKENKSISEAGQESKKSLFNDGFKNKRSSITKALNYVSVKENEYDENFFSRELKTFEALIFMITKEGVITKKVIFERWK